jgi:CRP/FNR family cyclic AMP-dependent transcriptional regulator
MILIESDLAWSLAIDNPSLPQVGRCFELPHRDRKRPRGRTDVRLELRSEALEIEREEMVRVMHEEHSFSDLFLKFLLVRSMRTQADLIDQLFNSSEKRLARILLLLAEFGKPGEPESLIPEITQETLAEMIGTTRSRVSFFMNRFRKLGFIEYNGRIRVHKSLLNIVLHD